MKSILFILSLALCSTAFSAPVQHDLGQGLVYWRVKALPADLPDEKTADGALVLDLRYTAGDDAAGAAFQAWLSFQTKKRPLLLILANGETAAPLRAALDSRRDEAGVITFGSTDSKFAADFVLAATAEEERTAYDALEKNTPIALLVTPDVKKRRTDEAFIVANRNGSDLEESEELLSEKTEKAPAPVIDAVLQRAVHLHRSLLALGKLPANKP